MIPRASMPGLRKSTFNWKVQDRYNELNNFKTKARNIFMINSYTIYERVKMSISHEIARQ